MLNVITRGEAVKLVRTLGEERALAVGDAALAQALGRVLARPVVSNEDVPPFDRTVVDGWAVRARDTFGASDAMPAFLSVQGEIAMGETAQAGLLPGACFRISTGGMLPPGADAAVMIEHTDLTAGECLVYKAVSPGENVVRRGADIALGAEAIPAGTVIGPAEVGAAAALGAHTLPVFVPPRAAVLSTGDELTAGEPAPGQIRDVNSDLLASLLRSFGCEVAVCPPIPDDRDAIRDAVKRAAAENDAVILSGGSSAGARDMTADVLGELGRVLFHGLAMKPGKPTVLGRVGGTPVFGLPGHPLAAFFVLRLVFSEYFRALYRQPPDAPFLIGRTAVNIPSNHGREEFCCARLHPDGTVAPIHTKSGIVSVLTQADCVLRVPRDCEGLPAGAQVELYRLIR